MRHPFVLTGLCLAAATAASAEQSDLAQQLSNPVANLISVPLQFNIDEGIGPNDVSRQTLNIQPVLPFSISEDWNLISRTIIPVTWQEGLSPGDPNLQGIGNVVQSFFFSPKAPTAGGLIWGAGPVISFPTATDGLGLDQWAAGPTAVALRVTGPLTVGALANHLWTVTDNDTLGEKSVSFIQPFISYTTPTATTFALNTESTYDWTNDQWTVPINATVAQLMPVFGQPVSFVAGVRYWAEAPDNGPEGWGLRAVVTYVFPK
jgi:hypothetical protein